MSQRDLRQRIVMVTQENFLFSGTVADNIRFGRPEATDDQVRAAAAAVGGRRVHQPATRRVPNRCRQARRPALRRTTPAGGFRSRLSVRPDRVDPDEATSSLDIPSERLVQRALRTVLAGRTALVIAHRLSTVSIADRVLVLEHGRVVEDGLPRDLIGSGGRYAALHRAWIDSLA